MRGGDKAPLSGKAKDKARRYTPFFKNVDESGSRTAACLTRFCQHDAASRRGLRRSVRFSAKI
jgi:hypothetical protein